MESARSASEFARCRASLRAAADGHGSTPAGSTEDPMLLPPFYRIFTGAMSIAFCATTAGAQGPVGAFDGQTDVGRTVHPGSAAYDATRQDYLIAGSGQNMWGDHDDFHFVWKRMTGNFILSTRARFIGQGVEAHRKIGWTIRPSLETSGAHVTAALHGDGLMSLQFRRTSGATTERSEEHTSE